MNRRPRATAAVTEGRRQQRKHVTRKELLTAGRELFGSRGLYESRIEDLSNRAGIAKGTLYGYFADKEDLIREVVNAAFGDLVQAVRSSARGAGDDRQRLARIVGAQLEHLAANPDLMRILHQARGMLMFNRREWRPLRGALAAYLEGLGEVLGSGDGGPRLTRARRLELAGFLLGAISGVASVRAALAPSQVGAPLPTRWVDGLVAGALCARGVAGGGSAGRDVRATEPRLAQARQGGRRAKPGRPQGLRSDRMAGASIPGRAARPRRTR